MNILLVVPRLNIGGAETYVAITALSLHRLGYTVFVASGGGMLAGSLREQGIRHFYVPIRLSTALAARMLARIIRRNNIDIVHANSASAGYVAVQARQYVKVPVVYTAHGIFGHNTQEMTLDQCEKIICVSEYVRQYALEKGFTSQKLVTLYSGIDLTKFKAYPQKKELVRQMLGIPADAFTLAIVARIKNLRNKGHEDILQILKDFEDAHNWHLMVIGKGKGLWSLKYRVWRDKLSQRVHCLGHTIEVQEFLDGADAVVLPSKFETFGLVLAEAMAMGKPVVTYAVGGTPEVIAHGHTGFLVEKHNLDELHCRLRNLAEDSQLRLMMGDQGRGWVESNFDNNFSISKLTDIYQEVLGASR
ncbi:glycosyltransferase family 4 protein [Sporomusa aerivorans]|uniref:glycosyltransferase family 4 protein n=1 Tax=Sporomusa aerivorans TaxID=204936 RepID=UPI00352A7E7D